MATNHLNNRAEPTSEMLCTSD